MANHGKKYRAAKAKIVKESYELAEAVALLKETSTVKFDASCEVHVKLGIDPRHADQAVRATVSLPHGTGKTLKIIAIVSDDLADGAKKAGAIEAGSESLIDKIAKGWTDFDVVVAMPAMMAKLGKVAKTLGQKGLMPSPKAGTVSDKPVDVIKDIMKGKVEFRNDKEGNLHNIFGKVSFDATQLEENLKTFLRSVLDAKPSGAKGSYVKSVYVTTTMGPSLMIDSQEMSKV